MELVEQIETINRQLRELYSIDISSGQPIFRIVWSNDELEVRVGDWEDYDKNGNLIRRINESRLVPKYIGKKDRYILERLVAVPDVNKDELGGNKVSYEPLWTFENQDDNSYMPPRITMCQFIINTVLEAINRPKGFTRYLSDQADSFGLLGGTNKQERMKKIKEQLFGNETPITDALMAQRGVSFSGLDGTSKGIILTDK